MKKVHCRLYFFRKCFVSSLFFLFSIILFSCASTKKLSDEKYLEQLDSFDYGPCISFLQSEIKKVPKSKDLIRDNYDMAMMLHYQKKYDESLAIMNETDRMMEDAVTKSISKGFASLFANDRVTEYAGNPYEYTYINIFNALNYHGKGDDEEAAVEIRRLNEKQQNFLNKYGEWLKKDVPETESSEQLKAYSALNIKRNSLTTFLPAKPSEDDIFKDSPTARYLSIVFAMMDDSVNNSWNIAADSKTLKALNPSFDVDSETKISDGKGRLDILAFSGLIGRRGEKRVVIGPIPGIVAGNSQGTIAVPDFDIEFVYPAFPAPTHANQPIPVYHGNSLPNFTLYPGSSEITKEPQNQIESVRLVLDKSEKKLSLLEDFNYAVQKDVNSKAKKASDKSLSRSLLKKSTAVTGASVSLFAADQVSRNSGAGSLGLFVAYLAAAKAIDQVDKTELADIRQVYALPARAYASGLELEPGMYSFKVQFLAANGAVVHEELFSEISVKKGKTTLVEVTCQK